jgi:hypothetical protein
LGNPRKKRSAFSSAIGEMGKASFPSQPGREQSFASAIKDEMADAFSPNNECKTSAAVTMALAAFVKVTDSPETALPGRAYALRAE